MKHLLYRIRVKVGIAVKEFGCTLIHGRKHLYRPVPQEYQRLPGRVLMRCHSCTKDADYPEPAVDG